MSADVNFVCVSGRLTKDVEIKAVGQSNVVTGSIAVNRMEKKDGDWKETASFFNFKNWIKSEKQIEFYKKNYVKGAKVLINGEILAETYEKDGQKRTAFTINATRIEPMGAPRGGNNGTDSSDFPSDFPN